MEGTVKFFNTSKGYGFISETTTKTDYFVHFTTIWKSIFTNFSNTFWNFNICK